MTSNENSTDADQKNDTKGIDVLASKPLKIMSKRYYIDVKQVDHRKFIKLVESLPNGTKNRLTLPMPLVAEFKEKLEGFLEFYNQLDPVNPDDPVESDKLKSETLRGLGKRFYLDLKENPRGRFLRISQAARNQPRSTIAIPGSGISEVKETLAEFLDEYGSDDGAALSGDENIELPEAEEMRVERKQFYFDCGQNTRGSYLRVSEVTNKYRSSITIPRQGLNEFADIISKLAEKMQIRQDDSS